MLLFTIISAFFSQNIKQNVEEVRIDGVKCTVVLSSDKTFAIGDGKKTAFNDKSIKQKSINIAETIEINKVKYQLVNISSYAFSNCPFTNVTFPNLLKSKISYLRVGFHCFEDSPNLNSVSFLKSKVKIIPSFCFANCSNLQLVQIGILTDTLQKYAFYRTGIQQIRIQSHITTIGKFCFAESAVEYVDMETTLFSELPSSFFEGCKHLKEVTLPKELKKLPKRCFYESGVENIHFPKTLITIGEYCFWNCTNLQKVLLGNTSLIELPKNCFENCVGLTVIYCPKTLTSIADYSLSNTGISEFIAPKSLTKLGTGFIQMCKDLTEVNMENINLPIIPAYSFYRCANLKIFIPPSNMIAVEEYCFCGTSISSFSFTSLKRVDRASFEQCRNIISANLSNLESPMIPKELFHLCSSLKEVVWPKGDLRVGPLSFSGTALEKISFPSLVEIGASAFANCAALEKVDLSFSKCKIYSKEVFSFCGNLYIIWPETDVKFKLGKKLFASSKITKVYLPPQCIELSEGCFKSCLDLSIVDLSKTSISKIPSYCFELAGELDFKWPAAITTIEEEAFLQCNMRKLIIPESITTIGERAFAECANIKLIDFSSCNAETVPKQCFFHCTTLKEVKWSDKIKTIEDEAFCGSKLKRVDIPVSVTKIGEGVFEDSMNLLVVDFSKSIITEIPEKTFANSHNLKSLMLPKAIKSIHESAFAGVDEIKEIYYPGTESNIEELNLPKANIFVPSEYKDSTFTGRKVTKIKHFEPVDSELVNVPKDSDEEGNQLTSIPQFEESHTTRNAVLCVVIVVFICVVIWFKCDPYGINGSENVELEGDLPWYKQILHSIGFRIEQMQTKTQTFTSV